MAPKEVTTTPRRFLEPTNQGKPTADPRQLQDVSDESKSIHALTGRSMSNFTTPTFAPTPRFGRRRAVAQDRAANLPPSPVVQSFRAALRSAEEIEESGAGSDGEGSIYPGDTAVQNITGGSPNGQQTLPLSPKRRRLNASTSDDDVSPSTDVGRHEPHPETSTALSRPPQFTRTPLEPTTSILENDLTPHQRPPFLRPPPAPSAATEPLPELFSPHRRGNRFIPGGLAATVQSWIWETGQTAMRDRRERRDFSGRDDYLLKLRVERILGVGPFTVLGTGNSGERVWVLFAGDERGRSRSMGHEISVGVVVGLRAPTWEVDVDGRQWTVAVDWKVLA